MRVIMHILETVKEERHHCESFNKLARPQELVFPLTRPYIHQSCILQSLEILRFRLVLWVLTELRLTPWYRANKRLTVFLCVCSHDDGVLQRGEDSGGVSATGHAVHDRER